jgi:hypothetical protein
MDIAGRIDSFLPNRRAIWFLTLTYKFIIDEKTCALLMGAQVRLKTTTNKEKLFFNTTKLSAASFFANNYNNLQGNFLAASSTGHH